MAKLIEQSIVVTVSKLARNSDVETALPLTPENLSELASVVEALAGDGTVVEVTQA
jgi:hypothetical protein